MGIHCQWEILGNLNVFVGTKVAVHIQVCMHILYKATIHMHVRVLCNTMQIMVIK